MSLINAKHSLAVSSCETVHCVNLKGAAAGRI